MCARVVAQAYDVRHPKGETVTADGIHLHGCDLTAPDALDAIVASHVTAGTGPLRSSKCKL